MNVTINLPLEQRKAIFAALVAAQDEGTSPVQARALVGERFDVNDDLLLSLLHI